ncbi:hypothetical protein [Nakamurella sp. PAMC28650]|uniref:hypothetical protein n=1 Tax=Nakamurella sp. PAMC28650 TaxID=2762325 RepID=UPI00164EB3EC|nr:hypothetical protein [Nakamurella sp. PAMC28650]QNK82085.1 hypothetical protein H7F38_04780 [Nakamurella sp. PAMC28650]
MVGLLKKFGWIGGLAALARTPQGQKVIANAKTYAADPETRRKLAALRHKATTGTGS